MIVPFLRALYSDAPSPPTSEQTCRAILEDIEFFDIGPQVYWLLKSQNRLDDVPAGFRERLKRRFDETAARNLFIMHETDRLLRALNAKGIAVIPLKGVRFAETYFGHPGARPTTDIDLLVRESDMPEAVSCVRSMGYAIDGERFPDHFHESFAKPLPGSPLPLSAELHWDLLVRRTSSLRVGDLWDESQADARYEAVYQLSPTHALYAICLHGWQHAMNSLKYPLDVAQVIHSRGSEIDYRALFELARAHRTEKRLASVLSIALALFPHLERSELPA